MDRIIPFLIVLLMVSCKNENITEAQKKLIVGDWVYVHTTSKKVEPEVDIPVDWGFGYEFFRDGGCEDKFGFFDWNQRPFKYYGSFSTFKIENDSLKIKDISINKFFSRKIEKLTADSLVVSNDDNLSYYIKKKYDTLKAPDFNGVVISLAGGMMPSYISNIYVQSNGNFIFDRYEDSGYRWYQGKISHKDFLRIQTRFKKANYLNLDKKYGDFVDDLGYTTFTIIKNNRIVKSVQLNSFGVPPELLFASRPVTYLPDITKYTSVSEEEWFTIGYLVFHYKDTKLELSKSESYYLSCLLSRPATNLTSINEKYTLGFKDDDISKITTDGRYYKFYFKDKTTKTVDIGYNFLTGNKLSNTFQKR